MMTVISHNSQNYQEGEAAFVLKKINGGFVLIEQTNNHELVDVLPEFGITDYKG